MRAVLAFLFAAFMAAVLWSPASADIRAGVTVGDEGVKGFYLAVGEYFRVPQRDVVVIREKKFRDEEVPVVLLIASRARVSPESVIKMRLSGSSWMEITLKHGLSPDIFFVPVREVKGPPYGKAYGHYKKRGKAKWKAGELDDADVLNLVNLKFISEHYGVSPDVVIRLRSEGKGFIDINSDAAKGRKDNGDEGRGRYKREMREKKDVKDKHEMKEKKGKGRD